MPSRYLGNEILGSYLSTNVGVVALHTLTRVFAGIGVHLLNTRGMLAVSTPLMIESYEPAFVRRRTTRRGAYREGVL